MLSILVNMLEITTCILNLRKSKVHQYLQPSLDNIRTLESLKSINSTPNMLLLYIYFPLELQDRVVLFYIASLPTYLPLSLFFSLLQIRTSIWNHFHFAWIYPLEFLLMNVFLRFVFVIKCLYFTVTL